MSGEEAKDELDRCYLWDLIFKYGPMDYSELHIQAESDGRKISMQRARALTAHPWFVMQFGVIYIACINGLRQQVAKVG